MMKTRLWHPILKLSILGLVTLISSCTIPGMRLNVTANGTDEPYLDFNRADAEGVDVFAINESTIRTLKDQEGLAPPRAPELSVRKTPDHLEAYKVGPQDVLRITVWDHPELNNPSVTAPTDPTLVGRVVSNDGSIFYPYVGTVQVVGKTTREIQQFLKTALNKVIRDPQVEVVVQTYHSKRVLVSGEVKLPGLQYIGEFALTASEAISAAGGATVDADLTNVSVVRRDGVHHLNLYEEFSRGDVTDDIPLEDHDVLVVPEGRSHKIFVMGEVLKQGSLPFPAGKYSLTDALGDCGGVLQISSNPSQIYVIRITNERPVIFHLNARNPDALLIADSFNLKSRDVIYVEAAEVSRVGRVISQILPAATALATGRTIAQ